MRARWAHDWNFTIPKLTRHRYGYVELRHDHPLVLSSPIDESALKARANSWIGEHRVVMAIQLGRELKKDEVVHHIDGDKQNNATSNLTVMKRDEHSREHKAIFRELLSLRKEIGELRKLVKTLATPSTPMAYA